MLLEQIHLGDHAAFFYRTRTEQLEVVIPFIAAGLEQNERCWYIAENDTTAEICRCLRDFRVDVATAQKTGALKVVTKEETHLRHGCFKPHQMIQDICDAVDAAVAAGYRGLRAAGELTWAVDLPSALAQIIQYEEELDNRFYLRFAALCQYDVTRFPPYISEHMKLLHPVIVENGQVIRKPSKRDGVAVTV